MPGLYDIGSNVANVSVSNTTGLYIGSGAASILNNAEQLLLLLSNQGNVNFALANGNTTVQGFFIGPTSTYSNANVAAYLLTNTGNVNAGYFLGDGSKLTNLPSASNYSNANVAAYLVTNTGNIAAGYYFGDGSQLSNLPVQPGTYTDANVAAYLPTFDGNIGQPAQRPYYVYSSFFVGDGSGLTNLPSTSNYGNANVAAYLPENTSNVAATYFIGDGSQLTNLPIPGVYGNANVAAYLLTNTGNIAAGYFIGDGSQLTNMYGNTQVAAFLPTYTGTLENSSTIQALFANAASQAGDINNIFNSLNNLSLDIASTNSNVSTLSANVGAFETYANANFVTTATQYGNTQVAQYLPTYTGNIGGNLISPQQYLRQIGTPSQQTPTTFIYTDDFEIYNTQINPTSPVVNINDAIDSSANLNITPTTTYINRSNLLVRSNATITGLDGRGGHLTVANTANVGTLITNTGVFWANGVNYSEVIAYGNTQVAAYLPSYTGQFGGNLTDSTQPGIQYIGPNPNNGLAALIMSGSLMQANANVINLNSGFGSTSLNTGAINITAYNTSNPNPGTINITSGQLNLTGAATFNLYGDPIIRNNGNLYADGGWIVSTQGGMQTGVAQANTLILTSGQGITWANSVNYLGDLYSNAATQATAINTINANIGSYQTYANANATTQATSINSINANLGAFQTYANSTFGTSSYGNLQMRANLAANSTQTTAWSIPFGGNSARPSAPFGGMIRYNTDYNVPEWYSNVAAAWYAFSNPVSPTPPSSPSIWYLAVAGGGSGGSRIGAGGGAGGVLTGNVNITQGTTYTITVGAGGASVTSTPGTLGNDGGNTSISGSGLSTITAIGGGGGGAYIGTSGTAGRSGGSGGGGSYSGNGGVNTPGSGTSGQGNQGGSGSGSIVGGGGGGGAGAVGQAVQSSTLGGAGGAGTASTITGVSVTYAGGGGGSISTGTPGAGGTGGGGAGSSGNGNATAGTNFLGGGGGGARNDSDITNIASGKGGDGVVIIRVANVNYSGSYTGSNVAISYAGGDTILKFSASGTYTG